MAFLLKIGSDGGTYRVIHTKFPTIEVSSDNLYAALEQLDEELRVTKEKANHRLLGQETVQEIEGTNKSSTGDAAPEGIFSRPQFYNAYARPARAL